MHDSNYERLFDKLIKGMIQIIIGYFKWIVYVEMLFCWQNNQI